MKTIPELVEQLEKQTIPTAAAEGAVARQVQAIADNLCPSQSDKVKKLELTG
jgi:hypothetical protein